MVIAALDLNKRNIIQVEIDVIFFMSINFIAIITRIKHLFFNCNDSFWRILAAESVSHCQKPATAWFVSRCILICEWDHCRAQNWNIKADFKLGSQEKIPMVREIRLDVKGWLALKWYYPRHWESSNHLHVSLTLFSWVQDCGGTSKHLHLPWWVPMTTRVSESLSTSQDISRQLTEVSSNKN